MRPERSIEKAVTGWFRQQGGMVVKLGNIRGIPDRLFIGKRGMIAFVEFKTKEGRFSKCQEAIHWALAIRGHIVLTIRTVWQGRKELKPLI